MTEEPNSRRLAAILAADVVGFSRLMEENEAATLSILKSRRRDILSPLVKRHKGRIFKIAGDGVLVEFASPVNAVQCAIELQAAMAGANESTSPDRRIVLRVGINLGDVMVEGHDLYGDGVNIAARIETLAEPGGILVSVNVFDYVTRKIDAEFHDLGFYTLKNISSPVRLYRVGEPVGPAGFAKSPPANVKPSIAVLPFQNISGEADQDYFADGMAEDIITGLSRIRWLTVIARNSTFIYKDKPIDIRRIGRELNVRYVLEGSVRKAGERLRITTQLIDAESGVHLWAERFDNLITDIFELQDLITASTVAAIEPSVKKAEIERVKRKRPENLGAYDLYLRALSRMYEVTPESRFAALDFVEKALQLEPDYAEAHGVAAWCYFARYLWDAKPPHTDRDSALRHAHAVLRLRTEDATTLAHAAIALALATGDTDTALEMIDRAILINPSSAQAHGHGAIINVWAGHYDAAIALAERALTLSPFDPLSVMPHAAAAGAYLMKGDYSAAISAARRALQIYPTHVPSHLITILGLAKLRRMNEARAAAGRFMKISPGYRIAPNAPIFEAFIDELRQAGLPEPAEEGE